MQIDVTNGKRFTEYDELAAVASGEDVLLVRLADGTGVKRIPLKAIKAFINGDLTTLETEDKTSLIAAINEVFGLAGTNADDIKALKGLTAMLGQTGASRANSFIYEHSLGTSFTAEQSADGVCARDKLHIVARYAHCKAENYARYSAAYFSAATGGKHNQHTCRNS